MMVPVLLALLLADPSPALLVRVNGLTSDQGRVQLALYDSKAAWDGEAEPRATVSLEVSVPTSEWSLPDLPAGEYAVKAFHDLDGDDELARSERGRPLEPYGFSGRGKSLFGPPGWKKARVRVGPEPAIFEIDLRGGGGAPSEAELEAAEAEVRANAE